MLKNLVIGVGSAKLGEVNDSISMEVIKTTEKFFSHLEKVIGGTDCDGVGHVSKERVDAFVMSITNPKIGKVADSTAALESLCESITVRFPSEKADDHFFHLKKQDRIFCKKPNPSTTRFANQSAKRVDYAGSYTDEWDTYEFWGYYEPRTIGSEIEANYACVKATSNDTVYRASVPASVAAALRFGTGIALDWAIYAVIESALTE